MPLPNIAGCRALGTVTGRNFDDSCGAVVGHAPDQSPSIAIIVALRCYPSALRRSKHVADRIFVVGQHVLAAQVPYDIDKNRGPQVDGDLDFIVFASHGDDQKDRQLLAADGERGAGLIEIGNVDGAAFGVVGNHQEGEVGLGQALQRLELRVFAFGQVGKAKFVMIGKSNA